MQIRGLSIAKNEIMFKSFAKIGLRLGFSLNIRIYIENDDMTQGLWYWVARYYFPGIVSHYSHSYSTVYAGQF